MIPEDAPFNTYCAQSDTPPLKRCKAVLNIDKLRHAILFECNGKDRCLLHDLGSYINKAYYPAEPSCFADDSVLFVQAACTVSSENLAIRKKHSLALGCLSVFIALGVINYIDYMKQVA